MPRTCLHDAHRGAGAVIVDFHGWEMPIRYSQIPEEHRQVRQSAGLFDLCHMGRLEFSGPDADEWVQAVVTADIGKLEVGAARYSLLCTDGGGIIDDLIVYRLPDRLFAVVNASNRERDIEWFERHRGGRDARLADVSGDLAMLALQGPESTSILAPAVESSDAPLDSLPYYHLTKARIRGEPALVATTGYTGEHGFEIFLSVESTPSLWNDLLEIGGDRVAPIGLGARDTLRVEAGMPLYGNELSEEVDPYEARLGMAVKLDKGVDFPGRDALARIKADGARRKLAGFRIDSRRIARQGMKILQRGEEVGAITSGIPSPTLGYPIAMGLVNRAVDSPDGLEVDVRGHRVPAVPEPLPFYSQTRKRSKRAL